MAKGILLSFLIMAIGVAWLLNTLHFIGGVDWIWTGALGATGTFALAWGKINNLTFVMGVFLLVSSVFSILRQTGALSVDVEVPTLVIVFGLLFLIAQLPVIPYPDAIIAMKREMEAQNSTRK